MLARGLLNFVAYTAYYLGLAALPMGETVALFFTGPCSSPFRRDPSARRVPPRFRAGGDRGFAGVLLIVRPGTGG